MPNNNHLNFKGFSNPTTTPVPDELFDSLMYHLSGAELKVVLYICRRTFGFKKDSDNISLNQMLNGITKKSGERLDLGVGMSKPTLLRSLRSLCENGVIFAEQRSSAVKGNEPTNYKLRMIDDPLGKKMTLGGYQNFTKGRLNNVPKPLVKKLDQEQQTVEQETVDKNDDVVIDQLKNFGISPATAEKFGREYPEEYLAEKLAWAQWLLSRGEIGKDEKQAGWLSNAIKGDFKPASDYETPTTRKAKSEQQAKRAEIDAEERRKSTEEFRQAQEEIQRRIRENHPPEPIGETGLTTESAWTLTLERIQPQISAAMFQTWLSNTMLISMEGKTANVVVPNQLTAEWLERRLYQSLNRAFSDIIGQDVEFRFVPAAVPTLATS